MNDMSKFDQARFDALVQTENWLGAWTYVKAKVNDKTEESVLIGTLANGLQKSLSAARQKDDKERMAYLRSLLAWTLRDYPGLASLYREQLRPSGIPGIPDGLQDIWRDFGDIISGRKTIDENFQEKLRDAASHLSPDINTAENLSKFAKNAEQELNKGIAGLRSFLGSLWEVPPSEPNTTKPDTARKVTIQDADDPIPDTVKPAEPPSEP